MLILSYTMYILELSIKLIIIYCVLKLANSLCTEKLQTQFKLIYVIPNVLNTLIIYI